MSFDLPTRLWVYAPVRRQQMTEHKVGTQEEWAAAVNELHEREQELGKLDEELAKQRQDLPWVPVEKEYIFDTEEGKKTLTELFDGRSQLLIYHLMFGPTYEAACPGCTGLADGFDGALVHLNNRDVTLMAISRAPIEKLQAYKRRMGWQFPYVSSFGSDWSHRAGTSLHSRTASSTTRTRAMRPTAFSSLPTTISCSTRFPPDATRTSRSAATTSTKASSCPA